MKNLGLIADSGGSKKNAGWRQSPDSSINDAREVAAHGGEHPFYQPDIPGRVQEITRSTTLLTEYMAEQNANPCVLCNTHRQMSSPLKGAMPWTAEFSCYRALCHHQRDWPAQKIQPTKNEGREKGSILCIVGTSQNAFKEPFSIGWIFKTRSKNGL